MAAIVVKNVSKEFNGSKALDNVSLSFERGKIYGLIGRNGAGKTVLMKLICGLGMPSAGEILVDGKRVSDGSHIPENIGAIIEVPGFLSNLTGYENLRYLARLRNKIGDSEIRQAMSTLGLDPNSKKRVGKYSLGMRQRLGIAQAIMENQDILLLDEPMNGLDIHGVQDVKGLLLSMRGADKTIVLASHHMEDISELCDTVYTLDSGRLINTCENRGAVDEADITKVKTQDEGQRQPIC